MSSAVHQMCQCFTACATNPCFCKGLVTRRVAIACTAESLDVSISAVQARVTANTRPGQWRRASATSTKRAISECTCLLSVSVNVFEWLNIVDGENAEKSFTRAHVLVSHCAEISHKKLELKWLSVMTSQWRSAAHLYSSWPAVSRMSSKHVSPSMTTCFR